MPARHSILQYVVQFHTSQGLQMHKRWSKVIIEIRVAVATNTSILLELI